MFTYFTVRITLLPFVVSLFTVILNANTWQGTDTYIYIKQLQPKPALEDYHPPTPLRSPSPLLKFSKLGKRDGGLLFLHVCFLSPLCSVQFTSAWSVAVYGIFIAQIVSPVNNGLITKKPRKLKESFQSHILSPVVGWFLAWRLGQRAWGQQVRCGSIRSVAVHADRSCVHRRKALAVVLVIPCGEKSKALVASMQLCFLVSSFVVQGLTGK